MDDLDCLPLGFTAGFHVRKGAEGGCVENGFYKLSSRHFLDLCRYCTHQDGWYAFFVYVITMLVLCSDSTSSTIDMPWLYCRSSLGRRIARFLISTSLHTRVRFAP